MRLIPVLLLMLAISCMEKSEPAIKKNDEVNSKETPRIIVRDGSFIFVEMKIIGSGEDILANISYTNKSNKPLTIYKALLPIDGVLKENVFHIFEVNSLDQVSYTGNSSEKYLKLAPDDDEGVIIPDLTPDRFLTLQAGQKIQYEINLRKFYDLGNYNKGTRFALAPNIYLPAVDAEYKQIVEKDSIDGKTKPVYYDIGLPEKENVDSMRVYFTK